jgi:hypothetical protein
MSERFKNDADDHGWALKVAKAICLLEFIRDLPRTEANLAAVLVDEVGKATPLSEVQAAVKRLDAAKFIRNTEEGWKLQTAQEKNWTNERSGHLDPKPREEKEITRAALQQVFDEPEFKTYRYQNRSFRIGINVDGTSIGDEGELPLTLCVSDDADELTKRIEEIRGGFTVFYRSIFDTVRDFLHDEALSGQEKVLQKYLKPDLLIIDDMGMKQLPKRSGEYLFEIVLRRHEVKSTLMTSNRPLEDWGKFIGDVPSATAILDRFLHRAEVLQIAGQSYRLASREKPSKETKAPTGS